MSHIRKLDPIVVDQIAAGEVVERPASVVKELVENAIDAGATSIEVILLEGGIRRIEVRDNGIGIDREELLLAVTSHATSKLSAPSDLEAIASLGFRGEALASIASVSRLEVISRTAESNAGASLKVDFGRVGEVRDAAAAKGTRFIIDDLFAELPARRKFLKRASTEAGHCTAWVERLALVHEGVAFRIENDGRSVFEVRADDDLTARCAAVFGANIADRMLAIDKPNDVLSCTARIGPPETARRDARRVHLFLNGRWVRDARLLRAVREGVREFVPIGYYPTLFLQLHVSPERVDVNVHPQKTEVRFRDERIVFGTVVNTLRQCLSASDWATRAVGGIGSTVAETPSFGGASAYPVGGSGGGGELAGGASVGGGSSSRDFPAPSWQRADDLRGAAAAGQLDDFVARQAADGSLPLQSDPDAAAGDFLSIANTFLFRPVPGGVEIIDQHALHERVNLEELRKEIREGQVVMQPLLVPSLVDLSRTELELLLGLKDTFLRLGVDVDAFGETTLAIRGVPARLQRLHPEKLVMDLLEIATDNRAASPEKIQEEMLFSMSCRGAVMAGDHVDRAALEGLLKRGANLPQDRTCAHGRPVRIMLTLEDLERAFFRR
ncbi:MAG: DNA mismatch repair endonuclease MutL [Planctomycetes bacterium]|nr:DNA mismatch repair endonuclease MutL [Planctomycetota bacterium]MCP4772194.1 DNA mismatch repair endonuclease MutL [Planctomycetota bacterium]MCP4861250.1 DNA mismatch repair endonuclease MutL [Planctomycetota bacterium]